MEAEETKLNLVLIRNGTDAKGPAKIVNYVRDLNERETSLIRDANRILTELTARSPYKHFQDRYDELFDQIDEINNKSTAGGLKSHELDKVYGKLDDLFSSLKGFEDRTKSLISARYGKESKQLESFRTALSYEFDNEFAYRFCYNLRNYSQHKGSHIGQIKAVSKLIDGESISTLTINLNGRKLLNQYSKWHSTVKLDLSNRTEDFDLIPLIEQLKYSCFRIYSKYLLSQEQEILNAIKNIKEIVGTYDAHIEGPAIMKVQERFNREGGQLSLIAIRVNLIQTIIPLLDSAHYHGVIK